MHCWEMQMGERGKTENNARQLGCTCGLTVAQKQDNRVVDGDEGLMIIQRKYIGQ